MHKTYKKSISRRQLRSREARWGGSLRQNHEAMYKNVIQGSASGASEPSVAKPSGLGRRVNGALAWWKLVFLSGEISHSSVGPSVPRSFGGNVVGELGEVSRGHSSRMTRAGSSCRRVTRPAKVSGGLTCDEGPNRNDELESSCSPCEYSPTGEAQGGAKWVAPARGNGLRRTMPANPYYLTTVR
jgi:hypothetical protein